MTSSRQQALAALGSEIESCRRCPRLVDWRERVAREKRRAFMDWEYWGRPVPGFGDPRARLLIVGLAPAAHGANRTGRMFTGDSSGDTLTAEMYRAGLANQILSSHQGDGLSFQDAYLTAVARCAPPKNRPNAEELSNCRPYLQEELRLLTDVEIILALGKIAFDGVVRILRERGVDSSNVDFHHGAWYNFGPELPVLAVSYHPSRQNTQTGRLTPEMFAAIFTRLREHLDRD